MRAGSITGAGNFIPPYTPPDENGQTENATPFWMVGASGVEVEVDPRTGRVRVTRLGQRGRRRHADQSAHRGDAALRRRDHAKLGFTLFEKMLFDADGQLRNASLAEYKIPGFWTCLQEIVNEAVTSEQSTGPFGGKGVGETATLSVSPAIANAIHDAIGVRLTELPMSPEAVWEKLRCGASPFPS